MTIVVTPSKAKRSTDTKTVFLGPVLSDAIFRTLVESRPEYSKAFYRPLTDFDGATEVPVQTIERHLPEGQPGAAGDVTSLPTGKNFSQQLKDLIGGKKSAPEDAADHPVFSGDSSFFELTGDISKIQILSRPDPPGGSLQAPLELEFELASDGKVVVTGTIRSSGDPAEDGHWEDFFKQWLFMPAPVLGGSGAPRGHVIFKTQDTRE